MVWIKYGRKDLGTVAAGSPLSTVHSTVEEQKSMGIPIVWETRHTAYHGAWIHKGGRWSQYMMIRRWRLGCEYSNR